MKDEITVPITLPPPAPGDCIALSLSPLERLARAAERHGLSLSAYCAKAIQRAIAIDESSRSLVPMVGAVGSETQSIKLHRRQVNATDMTPLTIKALAEFLNLSRSKIYADIERGYRLEFGRKTSPGHYRAWCQQNPMQPRTRSKLDLESLRADLAQLR